MKRSYRGIKGLRGRVRLLGRIAFGVIVGVGGVLVGASRSVAQERVPLTGAIAGRVFDQGTRRPLAAAEVVVEGTGLGAVAGADGTFRIEGIPVGGHRLLTRMVGYESRADSIEVPGNSILAVTVALVTGPFKLDPIVVVVRSATLERNGFYSRARQGYGGVFMDRAQIVDKRPAVVTDLFQGISGLKVVYDGLYGSRILINQHVSFNSPARDGCEPAYWIDGIRSTIITPDMMRVEELEGIEVYKRGGAPGRYVDSCGTIAFWTRTPVK